MTEPSRADIEESHGALMLEFGTSWCGHCQAAQLAIAQAMATQPGVRHIKIEDGKGRALGRSYAVKLWPTLVFIQDGREVDRLIRPLDGQPIMQALERVATPEPDEDPELDPHLTHRPIA